MTEVKFLNSLFLKNLIENQYGENDVQVKKFTVQPISDALNGRSSMCRIIIRYSSQESADNNLSVVGKIKPISGELSEEFKKCEVFDRETIMYKKVLPGLVEILKKAGGKIEIGPDLIYCAEVPSDILIFEDLTKRGYTMANQSKGLNLDESLLAVEKLAFFHAASVLMLAKDKGRLARFTKGTFHETNRAGLKYFSDAFRTFIDYGKDIGLDPEILAKLRTVSPKIVQRGIDDYNANIKGFQVLNHGDFWTGNLLYRYEGTTLNDVIFLDFQNCVVGSPIIDLMYFLSTSVSLTTNAENRDEIIYTYHDTLSILLKKLEYRGYIPSLIELQIEMLKRGALECIYAVTTSPYLRTPDSKISPAIEPSLYKDGLVPDEVCKTESKKILINHQALLNAQMKRFDTLGLLDWGAAPSKVRGLLGNFQR